MTPKVYIPEVTNVNQSNESDFSKLYEECDDDCVVL